jgi:hypothetical protein
MKREAGVICEDSPYSADDELMKVLLVDAAVRYDRPFDGRVYILLIQYALYVPSMDDNLLPPFMMRGWCDCERDTPAPQLRTPKLDLAPRLLTLVRGEVPLPACEQENQCHSRMPIMPTRTGTIEEAVFSSEKKG